MVIRFQLRGSHPRLRPLLGYLHRIPEALAFQGSVRHEVRLLPDHDPERSGEVEVETALRLLAPVIPADPRAFDLVLADALYAPGLFFNFLVADGKHALVVLKDERRNRIKM
jgi:hypothetical protein